MTERSSCETHDVKCAHNCQRKLHFRVNIWYFSDRNADHRPHGHKVTHFVGKLCFLVSIHISQFLMAQGKPLMTMPICQTNSTVRTSDPIKGSMQRCKRKMTDSAIPQCNTHYICLSCTVSILHNCVSLCVPWWCGNINHVSKSPEPYNFTKETYREL